jgi:hypothetical protein
MKAMNLVLHNLFCTNLLLNIKTQEIFMLKATVWRSDRCGLVKSLEKEYKDNLDQNLEAS